VDLVYDSKKLFDECLVKTQEIAGASLVFRIDFCFKCRV
jgi:hypothetical protein